MVHFTSYFRSALKVSIRAAWPGLSGTTAGERVRVRRSLWLGACLGLRRSGVRLLSLRRWAGRLLWEPERLLLGWAKGRPLVLAVVSLEVGSKLALLATAVCQSDFPMASLSLAVVDGSNLLLFL